MSLLATIGSHDLCPGSTNNNRYNWFIHSTPSFDSPFANTFCYALFAGWIREINPEERFHLACQATFLINNLDDWLIIKPGDRLVSRWRNLFRRAPRKHKKPAAQVVNESCHTTVPQIRTVISQTGRRSTNQTNCLTLFRQLCSSRFLTATEASAVLEGILQPI